MLKALLRHDTRSLRNRRLKYMIQDSIQSGMHKQPSESQNPKILRSLCCHQHILPNNYMNTLVGLQISTAHYRDQTKRLMLADVGDFCEDDLCHLQREGCTYSNTRARGVVASVAENATEHCSNAIKSIITTLEVFVLIFFKVSICC